MKKKLMDFIKELVADHAIMVVDGEERLPSPEEIDVNMDFDRYKLNYIDRAIMVAKLETNLKIRHIAESVEDAASINTAQELHDRVMAILPEPHEDGEVEVEEKAADEKEKQDEEPQTADDAPPKKKAAAKKTTTKKASTTKKATTKKALTTKKAETKKEEAKEAE
jgi:hypothetical protein